MEEKVLKELRDIAYDGPLLDKTPFQEALKEGPKSPEFTRLVAFITNELRALCGIDEQVNAISNPEDSVTFLMELSSFLKELGCPYAGLTQGHISDRLSNVPERLLLLDYLAVQLMAARVIHERKPEKKIELKLQETPEAADLKQILVTLGFPKPPSNITIQQLFQKLIPTLQTAVKKAGDDLLGNPGFNGSLSDKQWNVLNEVQKELNAEYTIRREMLLKRLDCTIQSFQWSDKTRGKDELIENIYAEKRKRLKVEPEINLSNLLGARDDIAIIEKTSSSAVRKNTQSSVNKVIIGQVPDRGGRTSEQAPPPPEMPSWQQRTPGGPSGGRGGRGGGGRGDFNNRGGGGGNSRPQTANYSRSDGGGGFDSAGSYGGYSSQSRVGNDARFSGDGKDWSSRGGHGNSYRKGGGRGSSGGFDSAGSFGGYGSEPKRPKTYDSFQSNRMSYAEQYVQETQQNQQYQQRGDRSRGQRGRSNYNRGGGGGGYTYR